MPYCPTSQLDLSVHNQGISSGEAVVGGGYVAVATYSNVIRLLSLRSVLETDERDPSTICGHVHYITRQCYREMGCNLEVT